jgi:uncharacterized integral membrane protein
VVPAIGISRHASLLEVMPTSGHSERAAGSQRKLSPRTLIAVVLGGLLVLFAALNSQTVTIHWIVGTTQTPLIAVIVGCGLIGLAVGWLLARRRAARHDAR